MKGTGSPFQLSSVPLFVRDFDDPDFDDTVIVVDDTDPKNIAPAEPVEPPISRDALEEARATAYADGLRQGHAEAATARADAHAAAVHHLQATLRDLHSDMQGAVEAVGHSLATLVVSALEAGFPELRARQGPAELSRFARDMVALLAAESQIVITVHPSQQGTIDAVLAGLEPNSRSTIRVELRETLQPGDARVEWRNGVAIRDTPGLMAQLHDILAPLGLAPASPPAPAAKPGQTLPSPSSIGSS